METKRKHKYLSPVMHKWFKYEELLKSLEETQAQQDIDVILDAEKRGVNLKTYLGKWQ